MCKDAGQAPARMVMVGAWVALSAVHLVSTCSMFLELSRENFKAFEAPGFTE